MVREVRIEKPTERVDERDTMFARVARREGTAAYDQYYSSNPDLKSTDDRIRAAPPLLGPGGRYYDPELSAEARRHMAVIPEIVPDQKVVEHWASRLSSSTDSTEAAREMFLSLGAVAVGVCGLDETFVYSHKGRFEHDYGEPVRLDHSRAIVFLVEMDFDRMQRAPQIETIRESALQYYRAGKISITAAAALRAAGFDAKAHFDAHYDVILPPLAVLAGLGEVGRNNILIADHFGSRVRIGAVTTDLAALRIAEPVSLGANGFCEICKKCADNCPSNALSRESRQEVRGVRKWPTNVERCYSYWRTLGTDCGICMAVCPFSHRDNAFHNTVRWMVRHLPWLNRIALFFEDLVYGRRWVPKPRRPE